MGKENKSLKEFYEFLRRKRISSSNLANRVGSWSSTELLDFAHHAYELISPYSKGTHSQFSFTANASMCGQGVSCRHIACRLRNIDTLARFTAFYADTVYFKNPFADYVFHKGIHDLEERLLQYLIIGDLTTLLHLKSLFEAGLLAIDNKSLAFCEEHGIEVEKLKRAVGGQIDKVREQLEPKYLRQLEVWITNLDNNLCTLDFKGPKLLFEHGSTSVLMPTSQLSLAKYTVGQKKKLTRTEIRKLNLSRFVFDPILDEVLWQNIHTHTVKSQYLSNSEFELSIATLVGSPELIRTSKAIMVGMAHSVPTVESVPIEKLLKLRRTEGESFEVYRDALSRTLRKAENLGSKEISQLVADELRPEINRIESNIKNAKKLLISSLKTDLLIGAGYITIGLFGGFLSPQAGELVAALGGYKFTASLAEKALRLTQPPIEAQENPYYFLWKIKKTRRRA